jgi:hypothetical protein
MKKLHSSFHNLSMNWALLTSVGPEALQMGFLELEAFKAFEGLQGLQIEGLNIKNDHINFYSMSV